MSKEYTETGGLRWGKNFWIASNFTWPFATLKATKDQLYIRVGVWRFFQKVFKFNRLEVKDIKRQKGFFGVGILIEHSKSEYPPFIMFWTFNYNKIKIELNRLGYQISE